MSGHMKILIGCDGSEYTEKVLADLKQAGLPQAAEVLVLTVAEHWLAAPTSFGGVDVRYTEDTQEAAKTAAIAQHMKSMLSFYFSGWDVKTDVAWGGAASKLIERADDWKPDLLVVGSHGRSALGRLFLGSVSQRVLHDAHCSVRIGRGKAKEPNAPAKILIALDGSKGANAAVDVVVGRHWPAGSQVRLVNATWTVPPVTSAHLVTPIADWIRAENERVHLALEAATAKLNAAGLGVSSLVEQEEPRKLICDEAENWGADCIFLGARGMGTVERLLIGSISSSVAAKATCSVEVVRIAT